MTRKLSSRIRVAGFLLAVAALVAVPLALADHALLGPGGVTTDDPAGDDTLLGLDGAGISSVEAFLGNQPPATRAQRQARNISLVGALAGDPAESNQGVFADVAGYKNLAFVGKWRGACPGTGVDIIDISRPKAPVKLADTADHADTSMEDMEAMEIGDQVVLGIGLQDCGNVAGVGTNGLELVDITDPRNPQTLSFFDTDAGGVHEMDLTETPDGRALALLAVPNLEAITFDPPNSTGDLLIVDISDPAAPVLVGEWGVLDEPSLGLAYYFDVQQGADARTLLHSARANVDGTRAYLSYWDGGFITLDISDPAAPVFLGHTDYDSDEEGNAHSVDEARGGNLLVTADEDGAPFEFVFTSNAFAGIRIAIEAAFTSERIVDLPGREMAGEVVHVGRGCPAGTNPGDPADPYLADPAGKIALIERGLCRFDNKIGRAQLAGAVGVIVYNNAAGGEALVLMGGLDPVTLTDGTTVDITIPAVFVQRSTGLALAGGAPPVTARAAAEFNGWGYLRFFDIGDPANPVQLSEWHSPKTDDEAAATTGTFTVHNPEVIAEAILEAVR